MLNLAPINQQHTSLHQASINCSHGAVFQSDSNHFLNRLIANLQC